MGRKGPPPGFALRVAPPVTLSDRKLASLLGSGGGGGGGGGGGACKREAKLREV
eukprot:SAG11_NODE_1717_length_4382_cov_13.711651_2_plen_54_part_00